MRDECRFGAFDDVDGGPSIRDMRATSRWFNQAKRVDSVTWADDVLLRRLLGEAGHG